MNIKNEDSITLVKKAKELGKEYFEVYQGCAQATLMAVADTLKMEVSDDVFKSVIGLNGTAGGCGGVCGASAIFGLRYGPSRKEYLENYSGYSCMDVMSSLFGRSFDFRVPEDAVAYGKVDAMKCSLATSDAAGWIVETIISKEQV
jgi:hypothetical protein